MYTFYEPAGAEALTALNVPFRVVRENGCVRSLGSQLELRGKYACLYFLGMSTESWMCSEWWGQQETAGDYSTRLFIGDLVAKIHIDYADDTQDSMPVIFGVNCWNYNLYFKPQPWEDASRSFEAPYDEPMRSDPAARALFEGALRMQQNDDPDAEKATRWVYAYNVRADREIVGLRIEPVKAGGIAVGGVTASDEPASLPAVDEWFFLRKDWYAPCDALARRLYQYRDELPAQVELLPRPSSGAPDIRFTGAVEADVFTNVYRANIDDMALGKVTDDGMPHTSSANTVNFGCYIGLGTFAPSASYATHVWTRDTGRLLTELIHFGLGDRAELTMDPLHEMLYYPYVRFQLPHWKRIANRIYDDSGDLFNEGKENDGHASIMMAVYSLYQMGCVDVDWLRAREKQLRDAADFFLWQMDNPEQSGFNRVLFSESEASSQIRGGFDLYSNVISAYALSGYARILRDLGDPAYAERLQAASERLLAGVDECFMLKHPRYGSVYTDTNDDCWTYEYKRFCAALMHSDVKGYDLSEDDPVLFDRLQRTFDAQREAYYHPESGRQMGYGQGYLTLSCLMLDRTEEYADCMDAVAHLCYHHTDWPYIVPEGVIMDAQRKRWFRNSDLGNGVQQAEIVKCARLIVGLDDLDDSRGLRVVPRLPASWSGVRVDDYPVHLGKGVRRNVCMRYARGGSPANGVRAVCGEESYSFELEGAPWDSVRMGPFSSAEIEVSGGELWKIRRIQNRYYAYVRSGKNSRE